MYSLIFIHELALPTEIFLPLLFHNFVQILQQIEYVVTDRLDLSELILSRLKDYHVFTFLS